MTDATDVATPLRTISQGGYGHRQVFDDWVAATLAALCRDDETYLEHIGRYPNDGGRGDREADHFAEATGLLFKATAEHQRDVLGDVFEELGLTNEDTGQFFTPHDAAKLSAAFLDLDGTEERICDPACGSGRMILEAAQIAPEALYVGRDLDATCARMAAINCTLFNLEAIIVHGDSLKMTRRQAWRTVQSSEGGAVREIDPDDVAWIDGGYGTEDDSPETEQVTLREVADDD